MPAQDQYLLVCKSKKTSLPQNLLASIIVKHSHCCFEQCPTTSIPCLSVPLHPYPYYLHFTLTLTLTMIDLSVQFTLLSFYLLITTPLMPFSHPSNNLLKMLFTGMKTRMISHFCDRLTIDKNMPRSHPLNLKAAGILLQDP